MYTGLLILHSGLRWLVLALGAAAVIRSLRKGAWSGTDESLGRWFVMALDIQLLLGLMLYFFFSPFTAEAMKDFAGAMRTSGLRLWAVEHPTLMVAAVVLAHIGRARSRRAVDPAVRHRRALLFYALALVATLLGIPWPGMSNGRPLIRLS